MKSFKLYVLFGLLLALAMLLSACGPTITASAAQFNEIRFTAQEYSYSGPDSVPAGMTKITLINNGKELHQIQLFKLDNGKTADDFNNAMLAGRPPAWAKPYGGPNAIVPGQSTSAILQLDPGNYVLTCMIPDEDGGTHADKGMRKALTVTGTNVKADEPKFDATIDLTDFAFNTSGSFTPGLHTIRVENMGTQAHEALLVKLDDGKTAQDFLAAFAPDAPPGPPPGQTLGGITGILPGVHEYFTVNLKPGNYALLCFLTDSASQKPHFELGMVNQFTIK